MSLKQFYTDLEIVRFSEGNFGTPSAYYRAGKFKGIIQAPRNSNTFNNGKDTSSIDGILFTSNDVLLREKDRIFQTNGKAFIVNGVNSQPLGVTGIKNHHVEYTLTFDNDSIDLESLGFKEWDKNDCIWGE